MLFSYKNEYIYSKKTVLSFCYNRANVLNISYKNYSGNEKDQIYVFEFSALTCCFSQVKPFTGVTHQYVDKVLAITVERKFVMPYHGVIVCFKLKRFARFQISTSVINTIITGGKTNFFNSRGRGFSSNFAFSRIFCNFLGCQVASCTALFWKHSFNSLLLMFSKLRVSLFKLIACLGLNVLVKVIFYKSLFLSIWMKAFGKRRINYLRWVSFSITWFFAFT